MPTLTAPATIRFEPGDEPGSTRAVLTCSHGLAAIESGSLTYPMAVAMLIERHREMGPDVCIRGLFDRMVLTPLETPVNVIH
jgi:hypothetical protein